MTWPKSFGAESAAHVPLRIEGGGLLCNENLGALFFRSANDLVYLSEHGHRRYSGISRGSPRPSTAILYRVLVFCKDCICTHVRRAVSSFSSTVFFVRASALPTS